MTERQEEVRLSEYGGSVARIEGLTRAESEAVQASIGPGCQWIRVVDGRLHSTPAVEAIPSPAKDEDLLPHWRRPTDAEKKRALLKTEFEPIDCSTPSILIQHLCYFCYTPEFYREMAAKLESYGFQCCRSRRDEAGRFWEIWFLPNLDLALGELAEAMSGFKEEKAKLEEALNFISCNVSCGTVDVCVMRLCSSPE